MKMMQETACNLNGDLIPRFDTLRWVSIRYRRILPLRVMQRYQCIVVGTGYRVLTVAVASEQHPLVIEALRKLTGHTIFPVLVDPVRMRLLIRRIERYEQYRGKLGWLYYLHRHQIRSMLVFLAYPK